MNKQPLFSRDLSIGYRSRKEDRVLHSKLNFSLHQGELNCILGPNGAGKSTLLKTLAGFIDAIDGEVYMMGKARHEIPLHNLSRILSVVLTDRIQIPHSRVIDIVNMGRYPYTSLLVGFGQKDKRIVMQSLQQVGIEHMKYRYYDEISDGEKQKVMIAKALAQDTPVIILDEPTAFLDFPSKIEVMQILLCLAKDTGKSILMSTHDVELALQVADKIWLLDRGKELRVGAPEDLVLENALNDFFEKDYIYFDERKGTFIMKSKSTVPVNTSGKQPFLFWLNKALTRAGFEISSYADAHITVKMNSKHEIFLLSQGESAKSFKNIETLIHYLKSHS